MRHIIIILLIVHYVYGDNNNNITRSSMLRFTCDECSLPYRNVVLDMNVWYHEYVLSFGALNIHIYYHHVSHNTTTTTTPSPPQVYMNGVLHEYNSQMIIKYEVNLHNHHTTKMNVILDDMVKYEYEIRFIRATEPSCGHLFTIQSQYQNISLYNRGPGCGERCRLDTQVHATATAADVDESTINRDCRVFYDRELRFLSYHVCPRIEHYQLELNGELQLDTGSPQARELMIYTAFTHARHVRSILVIGGAFELSKEFLKHPQYLRHLQRFVSLELDGTLVKLWRRHPLLRYISNDAFNDPRVQIVVGDGIKYLRNTKRKWDIIIDSCEVDITKQPAFFETHYDEYQQALSSKLAAGGISMFMTSLNLVVEAIYERDSHGDNNDNRTCFNVEHLSSKEQFYTMQRFALHHRSDDEKTPAQWSKLARYVMSQVLNHGLVGPEHHIFMSNEPFQMYRNFTRPSQLKTPVGGWCERVRKPRPWRPRHVQTGSTWRKPSINVDKFVF